MNYLILVPVVILAAFWAGHELAIRRARRLIQAAESLCLRSEALASVQERLSTIPRLETAIQSQATVLDRLDTTVGNLTTAFLQRGLLRPRPQEEMVGEELPSPLPRRAGWGAPPTISPAPSAPIRSRTTNGPSRDELT